MRQVLEITHPLETTVDAYEEFIHRIPWNHYCKLTFEEPNAPNARLRFKHPFTIGRAWNYFNNWKRQIKDAEGRQIEYLMMIDPPKRYLLQPHLHVLLLNTEAIPMYKYQQRWYQKAGWAEITTYNPQGRICHYIGEKMSMGKSELKYSYGLQGISRSRN